MRFFLLQVVVGGSALLAFAVLGEAALAEQQLPQVDVAAPASSPSQSALASSQAVLIQTQTLDQAQQSIFTNIGANAYEIDETAIDALPQGSDTPLEKVLLQAPGRLPGFRRQRRSAR